MPSKANTFNTDHARHQHSRPLTRSKPKANQAGLDGSGFAAQKVLGAPETLTHRDVLQLQHDIGNRATGQLLDGLSASWQPPIQCKADRGGLPQKLKSGLETMSGMDLSDVHVHRASAKPAQLQALAYTQGNHIHLGPGQDHHLPHEAWHVVQQRQGRVAATTAVGGIPINDSPHLENEADRMGAAASRGAIQRFSIGGSQNQAKKTGTASQARAGIVQRQLQAMENTQTYFVDSRAPQARVYKRAEPIGNLPALITKSGKIENQVQQGWPVQGFEITDAVGQRALYLPETKQYLLQNGLYWDPVNLCQLNHEKDNYFRTKTGAQVFYDGTYYKPLSPSPEPDITMMEEVTSPQEATHTSPESDITMMEEVTSPQEATHATEYSAEERGLMAASEIGKIASQANEMDDIRAKFPYLIFKYGMQNIDFRGGGEKPVFVWFKINPEFEVKLTGGHAVAMRSEGTGSGSSNAKTGVSAKTKVSWTPASLTLSPSGQSSKGPFKVGGKMEAHPLSQDHATGSRAGADSDHDGLMGQLPSKSRRSKTGSGSGPYFYIKGHLLNDNLGGIANEANLYPITHEANGQHKNFVEQYIKTGIGKGYVYSYFVEAKKKSDGYDSALPAYTVDADLEFGFARLDTAGNSISGTEHKGKIESRYKAVGGDPYDKDKEFSKDYGTSYNFPRTVGGEMTLKTAENAPVGTNTQVDLDTVSTFTLGNTASPLLTPSQSLATSAALVPTGDKLSLRQSTDTNVIDFYENMVKNWLKADITKFVKELRTKNASSWAVVNTIAQKHNLHKVIADKILVSGSKYATRISINGAPTNT